MPICNPIIGLNIQGTCQKLYRYWTKLQMLRIENKIVLRRKITQLISEFLMVFRPLTFPTIFTKHYRKSDLLPLYENLIYFSFNCIARLVDYLILGNIYQWPLWLQENNEILEFRVEFTYLVLSGAPLPESTCKSSRS